MRTVLYRVFLTFSLSLFTLTLARADYEPIDVKKGGTIIGYVKFPGEAPPRGMFGTRGDPQCPRGIAQEHLLVKQENLGLKNVLVVLEITKGKPLPSLPAKLNMKDCRFEPRLQWAAKNSNIVISNNDPTTHHVRALRRDVSVFTVDIPQGSPNVRRPLVDLGLYKVNCDRHLWERAWFFVSEHPYVAVTDETGRFEMTDVPPGAYNIVAWHEGWKEKGTESTGQLRFQPVGDAQRIKVSRGEVTEVLMDTLKPTFLYAQ